MLPSAEEALFLLGASHDAIVKTAQLYLLNSDLSDAEFEKSKHINSMPLTHVLKRFKQRFLMRKFLDASDNIPVLEGFITKIGAEIAELHTAYSLAMEVADLVWIQDYFKKVDRNRNRIESLRYVLEYLYTSYNF